MDGLTEQEIADKVGYKTASTVHKRIAKGAVKIYAQNCLQAPAE